MTGWASALAALVLAVTGTPVFTFQDARITESSNLVLSGTLAYTTNDSGDSGRVFVVDTTTGKTVGVTTYAAKATDVEAITAGPGGKLWIGDIGDNNGVRKSITVYEIPMPSTGIKTVKPVAYTLTYDGGARDAETLLVDPVTAQLYVVSKGLAGGSVFKAPETLSTTTANVLTQVGSVGGMITDGTFLPDGKHVLIRDYSQAMVLDTTTWKQVAKFALPEQQQGEGIAVQGSNVWVSSEGAHSQVLQMAMPQDALDAIANKTPTPTPDATRSDSAHNGTISSITWWLDHVVPWVLLAGWLALFVYAGFAIRRMRRERRRRRAEAASGGGPTASRSVGTRRRSASKPY